MCLHIALFRGINVGGKNLLPMKDLKPIMQDTGCKDIQTYIQSGNVVFAWDGNDTHNLKTDLQNRITASKGFQPNIHILDAETFMKIVDSNPYSGLDTDPKTVHVNFLLKPASQPNIPKIDEIAALTEQYTLTDDAFFLHAPDGIGRSKLAAKLEQLLEVEATGRNLRTVNKLRDMLMSVSDL